MAHPSSEPITFLSASPIAIVVARTNLMAVNCYSFIVSSASSIMSGFPKNMLRLQYGSGTPTTCHGGLFEPDPTTLLSKRVTLKGSCFFVLWPDQGMIIMPDMFGMENRCKEFKKCLGWKMGARNLRKEIATVWKNENIYRAHVNRLGIPSSQRKVSCG